MRLLILFILPFSIFSGCASHEQAVDETPSNSLNIRKWTFLIKASATFAQGEKTVPKRAYVFPAIRLNKNAQPIDTLAYQLDDAGALKWISPAPRGSEIQTVIENKLKTKGFHIVSFQELSEMAADHSVLVLNPYYRDQAGQIWEDFADFAGNEGWPKAREMRKKHTPEAIMNDARAAVKWLDEQSGVDSSKGVGTQGYCMGGPLAMWTAAAVPDRVKAAASFHGGGLVIADDPMSPHTLIDGTEGHYLIAIAQNDDAKAPEEKDILSDAISRTGSGSKVEVYAGDHGWTVPDSPVYAEAPAEQAWADLLAVYQGAL